MVETRLLSSLSKVFADEELMDPAVAKGSCLRGEVFSFQVAYRSPVPVKGIEIEVESSLQRYIDVRVVGLVPAEFFWERISMTMCYGQHRDSIPTHSTGWNPGLTRFQGSGGRCGYGCGYLPEEYKVSTLL